MKHHKVEKCWHAFSASAAVQQRVCTSLQKTFTSFIHAVPITEHLVFV